MLWYYRNPLNFIFLNEACIIASIFSWGEQAAWTDGVNKEELFEKTKYIATLIKRESVLPRRVSDREVFEDTLM